MEKSNIKQYVKYKVADSNDIVDAQIISRPGKWFNDASFGNLSDGSSQDYIIYLVNEIGECSPISRQSKKLQRVVKSAWLYRFLFNVNVLKPVIE